MTLLAVSTHAQQHRIVFPEGLGVRDRFANVKEYGAVGDGVTDDTAAIVSAYRAFNSNHTRVIYFPKGTYLISDTLYSKLRSGRWVARLHLIGESREGTVLKLADSAPGFGDPQNPKPMIMTADEKPHPMGSNGGGNRAFRNSILNMTLDLGQNNLGAIGIDYVVSNRGSIRDVTIRAPEGSGYCGIQMERIWPGPGLIKNVLIEGGDFGIRIGTPHYSMTVDNVVFRNQRVAVVRANDNMLNMRRIVSENAVPFFHGTGNKTRLVLIDSKLLNGPSDSSAIVLADGARAYLRDVQSSGYAGVIEGEGASVEEWFKGQSRWQFPSPNGTLRLPVKEIPEPVYPSDASQWVNVLNFGATQSPPPSSGDDTQAFQAAIDSGAEYILIPEGKYHVRDTIVVRGNVRMIYAVGGASLNMQGSDNADIPTLRIDETTAERVTLTNMNGSGIVWGSPWLVSNTPKPLIIRHSTVGYTNTTLGTGDLFIEDTIGTFRLEHPQDAWGVQVNPEFARPLIRVANRSSLWVFGLKSEMGAGRGKQKFVGHRRGIEVEDASLEVLGYYMQFVDDLPKNWTNIGPFITNDRGRLSMGMLWWNGPKYPVTVRERRGEVWKESQFGSATLYNGYIAADR